MLCSLPPVPSLSGKILLLHSGPAQMTPPAGSLPRFPPGQTASLILLVSLCHLYLSPILNFHGLLVGLFPLVGWELLGDYVPFVFRSQLGLEKRAPALNTNLPWWEGPRGLSLVGLEAEPGLSQAPRNSQRDSQLATPTLRAPLGSPLCTAGGPDPGPRLRSPAPLSAPWLLTTTQRHMPFESLWGFSHAFPSA